MPFREQVINYPKRAPIDSVNVSAGGLPKSHANTTPLLNGNTPLSPSRAKPSPGPASARNAGGPIPPQKPEDKESPEYKKKQAMLNGPILPMNHDNAASYGMTESLFTSLKDIFEALIATEARTGVVSPVKFLEVLRKENEMFRTSMHQDAHEFLNLLLNEVVANVETNSRKMEAERSSNGSVDQSVVGKALAAVVPNTTGTRSPSNTGWVHELFEGTLTSETKCLTCENVSQRDEAFLDLSVDLDQHSSVTSCLRKFSEEEMLCERNKFHCDMCGGLQEAEKRMKVKRLPKILALHLKRFKYTEDLQRLQKLFHRVVYPYHLRLFNTTDDAEDPDRLYELYAVVVHIGGGPYHGHYVAIIKTQDRGWLLFDDEMVEPVDKNYVRNFFGDRPGLACAYVLFYQETTLESVRKEQDAEGVATATATQATDIPKEPIGLGLRTNDITHTQSTVSPPVSPIDDPEPAFDSLDKAVTAPPVPPPHSTPHIADLTSPLPPTAFSQIQAMDPRKSNVSSGPARPMSQILAMTPKKGEVLGKKERAREEKERKAAEKEAEKADRARRKNTVVKRQDEEKKQATDLKATIEASKLSKAEEDKRLETEAEQVNHAISESSEGTPSISTSTNMPSPGPLSTEHKSSGGALSRFRQSSKSIRGKPKFWTKGKESSKDDGSTADLVNGDGGGEEANGGSSPALGKEKRKPFSGLRKKTSSMLL